MAVQQKVAWDEVDDFLTSTPTPEQIIAFRLSPAIQERLAYLLDGNREGTLNQAESEELDALLALDNFMSRLKLKALKKLSA